MFEFLFRYPARLYSSGEFVLLGGAPVWMLGAAIALVAAGLWLRAFRRGGVQRLTVRQRGAVWVLQCALASLLLLLLWQPALRVSALKPRQNLVAVIADDSRSMSIEEDGAARIARVRRTLDGGLLQGLSDRYIVRLYGAGSQLQRLDSPAKLTGTQPVTRLADRLREALSESAALPIGAVVLLSDGADNQGGIDLNALNEIRRLQIPVHTIGYGREKFDRDLEITAASIAPRGLNGARMPLEVSWRQRGYAGSRARLVARSEGKVLASRDVVLKDDGAVQSETLAVAPGSPGPRTVEVSLEGLEGESNPRNNSLRRLVTIESARPRVLYFEGEPKWDFKFIRRAVEEDKSLDLVTLLRTTQNKIYRQGIRDPKELEAGFPATAEDLFTFDGLLIGGVEASAFTPNQQEAIKLFADRRGGGVLFLAGRAALSDGGYQAAQFAEILPVTLPQSKATFRRDPATVELTAAGRDHVITRLDDNADKNGERWKKLPYLANYQEIGTAKPGAVVLAEALPTSKGRFPLLAAQNFGRGRVAVLGTSGTWRWKMLLESTDQTHATFWQQMLRWVVAGSPGRVSANTPEQVLSDETSAELRAEVRDKAYNPVSDAIVEARLAGPDGTETTVPLTLEPLSEGVYSARFDAQREGGYLAEVNARRGDELLGRDVFNFRREDGVRENFGAEQNRELLEKLSQETGGRYYRPEEANQLVNDITFSAAGLTVRETRDLWNLPVVFLLILLLRSAEWILRRRWGAV
jgi:uncharacterized membrane protein